MRDSVLQICVTAVGIALFVAFSLILQVPLFENYYLCFGYVVMAVYSWCFGIPGGIMTGIFGVILYCLLISGLRGMPGWAAGNLVIGLILGWVFPKARRIAGRPAGMLLCLMAILLSAALGILGAKSLVEHLLYTQPMILRIGKNLYGFIADTVVLWISLPVCMSLDGTVRKLFPSLVC